MYRVGIVNFGAGNVASVMKAVDYAGADPELVGTAEEIASCDKLVLPGVGASGQAIEKMRAAGLDEALTNAVLKQGKPFLGICVGMQLLAADMHEFGDYKGLGWVKGHVISLPDHGVKDRPVPHMGWSEVVFTGAGEDIARRIGRHSSFYFAHSFTFAVDESDQDKVIATVDYGTSMTAAVGWDNVRAVQFHPEKSQVAGDALMQWFIDWQP